MPIPASEEEQFKWKNCIEQQCQSGLSIAKWCHQNQIRPHAFYYWKDKLFPKSLNRTNFTELSAKKDCALTIEYQGMHIRLEKDCDIVFRKKLLTLLLEQSC